MIDANDRRLQIVQFPGDEISTLDIYRLLVKRKALIFCVCAATLFMAIFYVFITPPAYEASVKLLAPGTDTVVVSVPHHPSAEFKSEAVFQEFQATLRLREQWRLFVEKTPELFPGATNDQARWLRNPVPIIFGREKDFPVSHVTISYTHQDPALSARILRQYLDFTRERYIANLIAGVKSRLEAVRDSAVLDIAMLRQKARMSREDEIARLQQDLALAKQLGIKGNVLLRSSGGTDGRNEIAIIASNDMVRGYMRGTAVLQAELEALLKREADDPYIDHLREKQIEIERLNSYKFPGDNFRPYTQDGEIVATKYPVKPKKNMIIALAVALGLMLGVIAAFLADFIERVRKGTDVLQGQ